MIGQGHSERSGLLRWLSVLAGVLALIGFAGLIKWILWKPDFRAPDQVLYYSNDGRELPVHVFSPSGERPVGGWPAIALFHGGAWQRGEPQAFHPQCHYLSAAGYLCFSVGYRVAERDGSTPADSVSDARAAVRYLRANAKSLGIDVQRLALGGGSAGGHLAAIVATGTREGAAEPVAPIPVNGLVLFNPMLDLSPGMPDHEHVREDWLSLSPHHQVAGPMPPTLLLLGDSDPEISVQTAQAFCDRVQAFGGNCQLEVAAGQGHGYFNPQHSRLQFALTLLSTYRFLQSLTDQG